MRHAPLCDSPGADVPEACHNSVSTSAVAGDPGRLGTMVREDGGGEVPVPAVGRLTTSDLQFIVTTLLPDVDPSVAVTVLRRDPDRVEEAGCLRRRRFSDLSSEDMIALAALMPEDLRFPILRRVADIALFVTGIFPEHAEPFHRQPGSPSSPGLRWRFRRSLEEYEDEGRRFYRLAARHEVARRTGMTRALDALAEMFPVARKPLNVLASQYISTSRLLLFSDAF